MGTVAKIQPKKAKGARGVRMNPSHDQRVRDKIQTSQIINRLEAFTFGKQDPKTKKTVEMSSGQVTAALGLLKKTLPDLSSVDISGGLDLMLHDRALDELE